MNPQFLHGSLDLTQQNKIIFTSFSKRNFYMRSAVSQFVLQAGQTPISPFLNFDYNLAGLVPKDLIRIANNTLIASADELWVFGEISDGVLVEIYLATQRNIPIHYFSQKLDSTFREIQTDDIKLEDVSPWMWEWILKGKNLERWHPRLRFNKTYPLIYPAYSKRNFYLQMQISQFCIEKRVVPLNPFMLFRYFLGDTVPRESVYLANNNIVRICDEVWVFGDISDGVLAEIKMKRDKNEPVHYFKIDSSFPVTFRESKGKTMPFEDQDLEQFRQLLT